MNVLRRFVLRYRGQGRVPAAELARIEHDVRVLDQAPRMVLVESSSAALAHLLDALPRWVAVEEATVPMPDARPRARPRA